MKKLSLPAFILVITACANLQAQDGPGKADKQDRKEARREKINNLIRQSEEGVLVFRKQSIFGIQARTNGYGIFYELGKMKTQRKTTIYRIDIVETKSPKEEKLVNANSFFGNPLIYGKLNYFYPVTIGVGQQMMLGQKGNKNGVAVSLVYNGGLSLGLLRPYYVSANDPNVGRERIFKYSQEDSALFLGPTLTGSGGLGKGWDGIKIKPGAFAKAAMRFDYGRFNEAVSGLEIGMSIEAYADNIEILFGQKERRLFFQGYIAILFGRRK